jgi:predicted amino acid-binding ACT domain protein
MVSDIWQYDNNGHWRACDILQYDNTSQGILGNICTMTILASGWLVILNNENTGQQMVSNTLTMIILASGENGNRKG